MVRILKFGGTSIATADRMEQTAEIVLSYAKKEQVIIVVSALRGVTDQLIECTKLAESGREYIQVYQHLVDRHYELFNDLIKNNDDPGFVSLKILSTHLYRILQSIQYLHDNNLNIHDLVSSFGEQLSAIIFSTYLNSIFRARYVDARQFIITDNNFTQAHVLYEESSKAIHHYFDQFFEKESELTIPVVTGFIGMTQDNHPTTIGRDGSNYTAAILGAVLDAKVVEIWSDVDGVYGADPKLIQSSVVNPHLSYAEAEELSYFRAKVVRQAVIPQLVAKNIPIIVKNSFNPAAPGTEISLHTQHHTIKNISVVHELVLITLSTLSPTQINIPHLTERLFRALTSVKINFTLITQTSSAHDICFSVNEADLKEAQRVIGIEFLYEFQQNLIAINKVGNQSIIVLIGDGAKQALGILGKVLIVLEKNHIKISGIAHGTAECNISFIINSNQSHKALTVIHHAIFEKENPHPAIKSI